MARSDSWMNEFSHLLGEMDELTKSLVLDGSIEICPCCNRLSAYAYQDTTAYDEFEDDCVPGGFVPNKNSIASIGCAGFKEWQCGHCHQYLAEVDAPWLNACNTHA